MKATRRIVVDESSTIPMLDLFLAFGPMIPFALGAVAAIALQSYWSQFAVEATAIWGSAILLFLSGVRRGLSFRTEGGATLAQIATMFFLYCIGGSALFALWLGTTALSLLTLIVGYIAVLVLDPIAAYRGEAPLHFARLRRMQIPIALLGLTSCLAVTLR